jgi:hypothetical protein
MRARDLLAASAVLLLAARARADEAVLANGVRMTGIVVSSDAATVTLQVSDEGTVVLDAATVRSLARASPAADRRLRADWRAARLEAEARERKARDFEDAQRAKGLVLYEGTWMKPKDAAALKTAEKGADESAWRVGRTFVVVAGRYRAPRPSVRLLSSGWAASPGFRDWHAGRRSHMSRTPGRIVLRYHAPGVTSGPLRTGFNINAPTKFEIPY